MGLDTSHECWHGSYSSFSRWRDKLAEAAGYTFHPLPGDRGMPSSVVLVDLDWGGIEAIIGRHLLGKWPRMPVRPDGTADPLIVLLAHSDCEGEIQAEFCAPLANRLEALLPLLGDEAYIAKTQTIIGGLRVAAAADEPVQFH